jgi:UPF0042 nucleotide-binding protein
MSGAGRTQAGNTLEDLGWFVVDNLPVELVPKIAELARFQDSSAIALVAGTGHHIGRLDDAVRELRSTGASVRTLFLDASTPVLVRRYGDTKRRHPLLDVVGSVEAAVEEERRLLAGVRGSADWVVDTSEFNVHQLKRRITELFADPAAGSATQVTVMSFGYKHGVPPDADLVFDCRFLPNPHWDEELRPLDGLDEAVQEHVTGNPLAAGFIDRVQDLLDYLIPAYENEGKSVLTVAFGCTGGRHRSVTMAEKAAEWLRGRGSDPRVRHRDIDK